MKSFFLSIIKQIFALIIAGFIVLTLFVVLIFGLIGVVERAPVHVPKNSVLVIDLATNITDAEGEKGVSEYLHDLIQSTGELTAHLLEILDAIESATKDPRIVGILLKGESGSQGSGFPVLHEVRKALEEFKTSGKPVVSYFTQANVKDYFLASVADTLVLNPLGQVDIKGLAVELPYFGDTFAKYGIGIQITKSGKYKSAVEPFVLGHMSDFEKEQMTVLLNDLWDNILKMVSDNRNINKDDLKSLSEKDALFLASEAKDNKLVDLIGHPDQAFEVFKLDGVKYEKFSDHKISLKKYIKDTENKKLLKKVTTHKSKIAIVYVEGEILSGEGSGFNTGADRLERKLNEVRNDEAVKAVVLRVNSPGGSADASEKILHSVRLLQEKKPVVASFGTYAASGGYWVACQSNAIFTDPMSITGSIGVFGLLPNIEKIAKNYGVNFEGVSTGPFGTIDSFVKPRSALELAKFQNHTDLIYRIFLERVAEGRKLEAKNLEAIADGRVWSGYRAKEIGLADEYGGLKDAITHAAELANLSDWEVSQHSRKHPLGYDIFHLLKDTDETGVSVKGVFGRYLKYLGREIENFSNWNDPHAIYARMPFIIL